ncbi:MAG: hypothetical protein DRZ82_03675 [Thermoprotei archaeon]|nr:MAG: hypothetical protein DRZ82_03675 [Thermoprotei archaeon]
MMRAPSCENVYCIAFDVVILAGGLARRLNRVFKPLLPLGGKPMIMWIVDELREVANRIIVSVHDYVQAKAITRRVRDVDIAIDCTYYEGMYSPLIGALTGAKRAKNKVIFLIACDQPFIDKYIALKLVQGCYHFEACVPMWPNGYVEPLVAAYLRERFIEVAESFVRQGELCAQAPLLKMNVKYINVYDLCSDPEITFLNINSPCDYRKALEIVRSNKHMSKSRNVNIYCINS